MKRVMSLLFCVFMMLMCVSPVSIRAEGKTSPPKSAWWTKCWAEWEPSDDSNVTYSITIYQNGEAVEWASTIETKYDCHAALNDSGNGDKNTYYFTVTATRPNKRESEAAVSPEQPGQSIYRIAGDNRYKTAMSIADDVINIYYGDQPSEVIILASGNNFPDALSGSFLAIKNYAPILLINRNNAADIRSYVRHHLTDDGKIYVLGGQRAVADEWVGSLASKYNVVRLAGNNRYETNIKILEEAGFAWGGNGAMLVCTGKGYADSLSASPIALPMLLVGDELTDRQIAYLKERQGSEFHIIGGEGAVSEKVAKQLEKYGSMIGRLKGENRYATSRKIAEYYFPEPYFAFLATGTNYPDGLCGGPLASIVTAPILLVQNDNVTANTLISDFIYDRNVFDGIVLGGENAVSESTVARAFSFDIYW